MGKRSINGFYIKLILVCLLEIDKCIEIFWEKDEFEVVSDCIFYQLSAILDDANRRRCSCFT